MAISEAGKRKVRRATEAALAKAKPKVKKKAKATVKSLGSGAAEKARKALRGRGKRLRDAMKKAGA